MKEKFISYTGGTAYAIVADDKLIEIDCGSIKVSKAVANYEMREIMRAERIANERVDRFYSLVKRDYNKEARESESRLPKQQRKKYHCLKCGVDFGGTKSNRLCGSCSAQNAKASKRAEEMYL
jgi:rubrerythrin